MTFKAVIFDLFGTLTDISTWAEDNKNNLTTIADLCLLPSDNFRRLWYETSYDRNIGKYSSVEDNIENICDKIGVNPERTKLKLAVELRYKFITEMMKPREGALDVISSLKTREHKIGLISNCATEVPLLWETSPFAPLFDITVFSCVVGINKPDAHIYRSALKQLAIKSTECLYIDDTLEAVEGASNIGMRAILIRNQGESLPVSSTNRNDLDYPVIRSLNELMNFVD